MTYLVASRTPRAALALLGLVVLLFTVQIGAFIARAIADTGGGASSTTVVPDVASDVVAATAAEFRVDESGAATYSIPLYGVPGTAGVMPKLALSYSSQGGPGPIGKGWSISGMSSITRCRATREAGDFIGAATPDGNPAPINFTATDRYCLDGQRLIPAQSNSAACPGVSGMSAQNLRTEIESFQRVCAYTPTGGTAGVAFFTVNRKDGSTSWYGDRVVSATQSLGYNGYVKSTASGKETFAIAWAQTRFQDSTGNYIDFVYSAQSTGEHLISEVRYTGKTVLSGQTGSASNPYAKVQFVYAQRPAGEQSAGYVSGGAVGQKWRLDAIVACNTMASTCLSDPNHHARYYLLTYAAAVSGSGQKLLGSVQECRDSTMAVCLPATTFTWSSAKNEFVAGPTWSAPIFGSALKVDGYKLGDINGDGRPDLVWLKDGSSGERCTTEYINVAVNELDAQGRINFRPITSTPICSPTELSLWADDLGWQLFDYDGDGRDDLFVAGGGGPQTWGIYPSLGEQVQVFDNATNLISGISITASSTYPVQPQLADLNGDSQLDVVYSGVGGTKVRLMTRSGSNFQWGAEKTVVYPNVPNSIQCTPDVSGGGGMEPSTCTLVGVFSGAMEPFQLYDFNVDSASDLIARAYYHGEWTPIYGCPPGGCEPQPIDEDRYYTMTVSAIGSTSVTLSIYGPTVKSYTKFADFNGDGLTDQLGGENGGVVQLNTGTGFVFGTDTGARPDRLELKDINGDGRTDLIYPRSSLDAYSVRYALPSGGFSAEALIPGGGVATSCSSTSCLNQYIRLFADMDGDGGLDYYRIQLSDSSAQYYYARAGAPYSPRDTITKITNGLGSITQIGYAPLTNAAIYRRRNNSRNTANWGRGSPVLDLLAPTYVVASASSSSPQAGSPNAMATLYYRYADARVQAGGRGFLGFGEIVTIDPNQSGGYVTTQTVYAQGYPFVGMPVQTVKRAATGSYALSTCLTQPVTNACFMAPETPFPAPAGNWFSDAGQDWQGDTDVAGTTVTAFSATMQAPVHVRPSGSDEQLRDPFTGVVTSGVITTFTYGAYGNAVGTQVDTVTGVDTATETVITSNTYSDNASAWLLGRLSQSTVTHRRPNRSDIVRTTGFSYSGATGLMLSEQTQPGGGASLDLRKQYTLDDYGNRTVTRACADPATAAACAAAVPLHPATATTVLRHARVAYSANGRYPVVTYELFSNGTAPVEKATQTVVTRNLFGDVTQAYDVNGLDTLAVTGTFGRPYYAWTETVPGSTPGGTGGVESRTTYHWCGSGGVDCPADARFRQTVTATAAPAQWTYFDVLGRPTMKAAASFNAGVSGKDASAVCTRYDQAGKPVAVSNPFFLSGTVASGPAGTGAVCSASTLKWTTTTYDVLGRPIRVDAPNVGDTRTVTTTYSGLTTYITDALNRTTTQRRNGLGELTNVTDPAGLVTYFGTYADGSLYYVNRDAGRGVVQNAFAYDAMGRKIHQNDPDSGIATFEYNALGELVAQEDADGNRIEHELDMRGRVWRRTVRLPTGNVESTSAFEFDTAANGIGQLASESIAGQYAGWAGQANTALGFSRSYGYDSLGRPLSTATMIDGANYSTAVAYDSFGRVWRQKDASGRYSENEYNTRGFLREVCEYDTTDGYAVCAANANNYLTTLETDAWGHVIRERRGNSAAMDVVRNYWDETGTTHSICAGTIACNLVDEDYAWDGAGNLTARRQGDNMESYLYDGLNRLTQATLVVQGGTTANTITQRFEYDALGNLCYRHTLGTATRTYTYIGRSGCGLGDAMNSINGGGGTGPLGPHQLNRLSGSDLPTYYYDGRGNQTSKTASVAAGYRTLLYSADNRPHELRGGSGENVRFWYGSDGQRYKRLDSSGRKTLYLGNVEIVVEGVTAIKRTVAGVMLQTVVGTTAANYYLFHDQLGSLVRIADAAGEVVNSLDYQAHGARRHPDTESNSGATVPALTTRGFTGHEMVDGALGIIHMNGRIYDHYLGRFLQPDPVVQAPDSAQSWNAYTYAFNNPLVYTDPTGMMSWRQILGIAIAIVGTYVTMGADGGFFMKLGLAMAFGAASGYVATGTFRGAVTGAFTAGLTFGVGWAAQGWSSAAQVGAQAVTGGIIESLQGGNFGNGFVTAGLTAAVMPNLRGIRNDLARTAVGAIVGGTISEATGGKFANGAISGAIQAAMAGTSEPNSGEDLQNAGNAGADWGRDPLTAYGDKISSTFDPFSNTWNVAGSLTVDGVMNTQVAQTLSDAYSFSLTNGNERIAVSIGFSPVASGGDLSVRWFTNQDISALQASGNWPAGGRMRFGSKTMELSQQWWKSNLGTVPHEFGHGLGLHHAPRGSGSYMSPSMIRSWHWNDAVNMKNQFICNPASLKC